MTGVVSRPTLAAQLADGSWHRGCELAKTLGVTRAAVTARVADLCALGLDIHSVAGRGFRLAGPLELLDSERIRAQLASDARDGLDELLVLERTDSTNAELARRADGTTRACLAEYQSAGRGRAQRPWASPFGANLYLSLARDLLAPKAPLGALSLAIGVCVAEALIDLGAVGIALKWPNDLWAGGRKLGGILVEHKGEIDGRARLVVGLGINVAMAAPQAAAIDQPWTRLRDHVPVLPGRNALAARLLEALIAAVNVFETHGFEPFHARWQRFDVARDRSVRVIEARGERHGIARGIAADGALQIEADGDLLSLYSGDVSLRLTASESAG